MSIKKEHCTRQTWLACGGIASLAAADFLIRDGNMPGNHITIFEKGGIAGGSLDAAGPAEKGYTLRGGRMLNFSYLCTYDLLSSIPSLTTPGLSVHDEMHAFRPLVMRNEDR